MGAAVQTVMTRAGETPAKSMAHLTGTLANTSFWYASHVAARMRVRLPNSSNLPI